MMMSRVVFVAVVKVFRTTTSFSSKSSKKMRGNASRLSLSLSLSGILRVVGRQVVMMRAEKREKNVGFFFFFFFRVFFFPKKKINNF